jgi:hypothetical protein
MDQLLDFLSGLLDPFVPTYFSLRSAAAVLLALLASAVIGWYVFDGSEIATVIYFFILWLAEVWLYHRYRLWRGRKQVESGPG